MLSLQIIMANANHIPVVKFHKRKYGEELLIDIVTLETIRRSKHFTGVQRQSFYGIMLTTAGEANVEVDGHPCIAKKGLVACARPGDVCTVRERKTRICFVLCFTRC